VDLPEHMQPSSDARIATWVGGLVALAVGALALKRRRDARP
jgi:MYXO-CTERM domain-containing protein